MQNQISVSKELRKIDTIHYRGREEITCSNSIESIERFKSFIHPKGKQWGNKTTTTSSQDSS